MKKFFTRQRILAIIILLAAILAFTFSIIGLFSSGEDYTEEYQVYLKVKELTSSEEIRSKLQELKIEYTISSGCITIDQYDYVSFEKKDATWQIKDNTIMAGFEKLDKEDLNEVSITGEKTDDGNIKEVVSCHYDGCSLTKVDNHYYADEKWSLLLLFPGLLFLVIGVTILIKSS